MDFRYIQEVQWCPDLVFRDLVDYMPATELGHITGPLFQFSELVSAVYPEIVNLLPMSFNFQSILAHNTKKLFKKNFAAIDGKFGISALASFSGKIDGVTKCLVK